jgi:hypothetical protein
MTEITTCGSTPVGLVLGAHDTQEACRDVGTSECSITSSYTSQPAPNQWIAVATIALPPRQGVTTRVRLLVGVGTSEAAAIEQLRARIASLVTPSATA